MADKGSVFLVVAPHGIVWTLLNRDEAESRARITETVVAEVPIVADYRKGADRG